MKLNELRGRLFIGVPEAAAEVFEVDERTVRRAIADGQIPGVKVGNKTLIPVPKLLALMGAEYQDRDHGSIEQVIGAGQTDAARGPQILPRIAERSGDAA